MAAAQRCAVMRWRTASSEEAWCSARCGGNGLGGKETGVEEEGGFTPHLPYLWAVEIVGVGSVTPRSPQPAVETAPHDQPQCDNRKMRCS